MYKWTIKKFYDDTDVSTAKDGFKTYNQCLEDVLKHTTINNAFRTIPVFKKIKKKITKEINKIFD